MAVKLCKSVKTIHPILTPTPYDQFLLASEIKDGVKRDRNCVCESIEDTGKDIVLTYKAGKDTVTVNVPMSNVAYRLPVPVPDKE